MDVVRIYEVEECKERDVTYAAPLKVKVRLVNRETNEVKEQEVFMGDFPLMTDTGSFIINGAERVIVSQLVRSPGIYYASEFDKVGKKLLSSTVIPNRGAWLEYETDSNDVFYVRVDRTRKVPVSVLIRAMGVGSDAEIIELFGEEPKILATLEKDTAKSYEEGLIEIYKKLRPGEPPTVESSASLLNGMFFDPKRYDLAKVGRYKFNKKLALRNRVRDAVLAENVVDPMTGEVVAEEGATLTMELCDQIQDTGVGYIYITAEDRKVKILTKSGSKIDSVSLMNKSLSQAVDKINNDPERYFVELQGEEVPTSRNKRVAKILAGKQIMKDPEWYDKIKAYAVMNYLNTDEALKVEIENINANKPLIRDMEMTYINADK